jgi:competence protein ComEC
VLRVAGVWGLRVPQPDILISADGRNVGVRGSDGRLHLMRSAKDGFLVKEWLAADADARTAADVSLAEGVSCDESGCVTQAPRDGFVVDAVKPGGMDRPWSPAIAGDSEAETAIPAPRTGPPRPIDATPSEADVQTED